MDRFGSSEIRRRRSRCRSRRRRFDSRQIAMQLFDETQTDLKQNR